MKNLLIIIAILFAASAKSQTALDSIWSPKFVNYNGGQYQINFFVNHAVAPETTPHGFRYYPAQAKVYRIVSNKLQFVKTVPAKWPDGDESILRSQSWDYSKLIVDALKP